MKNKNGVVVAVIAILTVGLVLSFLYLSLPSYTGSKQALTVAVPSLEQDALLYVALNQSYFENNGLNVMIKNYDSGVTAINGMLNGEANIAEAAEFPFVSAIMGNESISVIACNDKFENDYIVCLQSHGIHNISDLKGKTVGLARGTIVEFYLGRFLQLHSISLQEVTLVNLKPAEFVNTLAAGTVDAIAAWQPYINQMQNEVADTISWPVQNSQAVFGVLICENDWLYQNANVIQRFLQSLKQAEDYIINSSDNAKVIIQNQLYYTNEYIQTVWPQHSFSLSLDQTLIMAMTDEAQWLITNRLVAADYIPDFADYIYTDALMAVKPQSVNIIL